MPVESTWHPIASLCNSYSSYCWHIICVLNPKCTGWWQTAKQGGKSKFSILFYFFTFLGLVDFCPWSVWSWLRSGLLENNDGSLGSGAAGIVWPRDHPVTHWPGINSKKMFCILKNIFYSDLILWNKLVIIILCKIQR